MLFGQVLFTLHNDYKGHFGSESEQKKKMREKRVISCNNFFPIAYLVTPFPNTKTKLNLKRQSFLFPL